MGSPVLGLREGVFGAQPVTSSLVGKRSAWNPTWARMDDGGWLVGSLGDFSWDMS